VKAPKIFIFSILYQLVKLIIFSSLLEGQLPHPKGKHNNSKGKDIAFGGMIGPICSLMAVVNLRGHIALYCSFVLVKQNNLAIFLKVRSESKITDLDTQL
jgi:hypothetical protein